jgi:ATP-dependent Clp protease ATP-binding subunit ClpX
VLTYLDPLNEQVLKRILTEPKNAIIKQYEKLFDMDGIKLTWDKRVLDYIVEKAIEFKLGARGLRSICEAIMIDVMFEMKEVEGNEVRIGIKYAREKLEKTNLKRLRAA